MRTLLIFILMASSPAFAEILNDPMALIDCKLDEKTIHFEIAYAENDSFAVQKLEVNKSILKTTVTVTKISKPNSENDFLPFSELHALTSDQSRFVLYSKDGDNYFLSFKAAESSAEESYRCEVARTKPGFIFTN